VAADDARRSSAGTRVLWGSNPIDRTSRADYFDSMYHAAAVVGLNTSALVEAAIVDRPVFTLLLPEFRDNQEGTFHFHHLLTVGDGFLHVSRSIEEHATQWPHRCQDRRTVRTVRSSSSSFVRTASLSPRRPCSPMLLKRSLARRPCRSARRHGCFSSGPSCARWCWSDACRGSNTSTRIR
jgi:hypothetical protein